MKDKISGHQVSGTKSSYFLTALPALLISQLLNHYFTLCPVLLTYITAMYSTVLNTLILIYFQSLSLCNRLHQGSLRIRVDFCVEYRWRPTCLVCPQQLSVTVFNVTLLRIQELCSQHIVFDIPVRDINDQCPHCDVKTDQFSTASSCYNILERNFKKKIYRRYRKY